SRARDAEVAQAARDERTRLVVPKVGKYEIGALVVEGDQPLLVGGEPEEVVLLFDPLRLREVDRAEPFLGQLLLVLELLAADAVPAGVHVLVDIAVVVHPLQELADEALVAVILVRMKKSMSALSRSGSSRHGTAMRSAY